MPKPNRTILFTTKRLAIRELTPEDAPFMFELMNTPDYLSFIGDKKINSVQDAEIHIINDRIKSYKIHGFGLWLVELKETSTPIGTCGLIKRDISEDVDIGFAFLPSYFHKGYAFEASEAALSFAAKELRINKIVGYTSSENKASIALLKKLGLTYEKEVEFNKNDVVSMFSLKSLSKKLGIKKPD